METERHALSLVFRERCFTISLSASCLFPQEMLIKWLSGALWDWCGLDLLVEVFFEFTLISRNFFLKPNLAR
jgi:hypothetical protein